MASTEQQKTEPRSEVMAEIERYARQLAAEHCGQPWDALSERLRRYLLRVATDNLRRPVGLPGKPEDDE